MNTAAAAELQKYPKYRASYIRAFERMLKSLSRATWKTGEDVMNWWLKNSEDKDKPIDGQERMNV